MYNQEHPFNQGEGHQPDPVLNQHCEDSPQAEPECGAQCECNAQPDFSGLNLVQKKEKSAQLQKETEELKQQVPPLFAEIETVADLAQESLEETGDFAEHLVEIRKLMSALDDIELAITTNTAAIEALKVSECCERATEEARKYCGTCGTDMGDIGRLCTECNSRNHADCNYCYNCRADLQAAKAEGEECSSYDAADSIGYSASY